MGRIRTSIIWSVSKQEFQNICSNSNSLADILRHFNLHTGAGNYKTLKRRIEEDNIDMSHMEFSEKNGFRKNNRIIKEHGKYFFSLEEVFCENPIYKGNNQILKQRLLEENIWTEEICNSCGIGTIWNGKPITLQVDHINGISNDNRIENLRLLCPNCHSQTKTWGAKRLKQKKKYFCSRCKKSLQTNRMYCDKCIPKTPEKIDWPSPTQLIKLLTERGNLTQASKTLGISANAIKKHLKREGYDVSWNPSTRKLTILKEDV